MMQYRDVGDVLAAALELEDGTTITAAINRLALGIERLGLNRANTDMGALECLSKELRDGTERIAEALEHVAAAIVEASEWRQLLKSKS